ncbi:MAG TPA: hypothetical protein VJZ91_06675 [Blastocatellia bacterium]|nr:hypothetical protein [Blastocatellia bacterium]
MKSYRRWMTTAMLLALVATGVVVSAQDKADKSVKGKSNTVIVQRGADYVYSKERLDGEQAGQRVWVADDKTGVFIASEMLTRDAAVKGAPYSAQAVTETIQTLADGNRIVRRTTSNVYRDSEGRTRRDQSVGDVAPYATAVNEPSQVSLINDPVSGAHYTLDPRSKTARKMTFIISDKKSVDGKDVVIERTAPMVLTPEQMAEGAVKAHIEVHAAAGDHLPMPRSGAPADTFNFKVREPKIEKLGKQIIEGVEAEGQRATITIPAGDIGNEQPINIVSESWYSPELQMTVMTRHSDPRMGETVYRLTGINRAEPPHSLFEVPSDYTVKESVEPTMKMKMEREMVRSRKSADKQEN